MGGGGGRVGLWGAVPCVLMGNRLVEKLVGFEGFGDGCKLNAVLFTFKQALTTII